MPPPRGIAAPGRRCRSATRAGDATVASDLEDVAHSITSVRRTLLRAMNLPQLEYIGFVEGDVDLAITKQQRVLGQGIVGALHEQHGDVDVGQVLRPFPRRLEAAGRNLRRV